eukprot:1374485-Rhodomonas_salina.1
MEGKSPLMEAVAPAPDCLVVSPYAPTTSSTYWSLVLPCAVSVPMVLYRAVRYVGTKQSDLA